MESLRKNGLVIGIVSIFILFITNLFICYKILIYEQKIETISNKFSNLAEVYEPSGLPELMEETPAADESPFMCRVYITGAVRNPGLYDLAYGSRVADLVDMAGGGLADANLDRINLAAYIEDARHVIIPFIGADEPEAVEAFAESSEAGAPVYSDKPAYTGPVNINTASADRLMSLPGIGQVIANNIIQYRQQNGPFSSAEELKNVSRIGDSVYNNIKDMIVY